MTMQMRDAMLFDEEHWLVWGDNGTGYFVPREHGLPELGGRSTACYHGYFSTYHLQENQFHLLQLQINLDEKTAPPLNGRLPIKNASGEISICGDLTYFDVGLPIPFAGGLLLCRELADRPTGLGPELAWRFKQIRELIFQDGRLLQIYDRSEAIDQIREEIRRNGQVSASFNSREEMQEDAYERYTALKARINSHFQFDY